MKWKFSATLFAVWISKNISCTYTLFLLHMKTMNDVFACAVGSPSLISFYCVCFVSSYFLLFVLSFSVSSIACWGIAVSLGILKINQRIVLRFPRGVSRGELLQLHLVIYVSGLVEPTEPGRFSLGNILVTSLLPLPLRITCCRVSPWN